MSRRTDAQTGLARTLRATQTGPETRLWQRLRGGRLNGYKFVRQHPIGKYIADFCCRAHMLVVEVDGATHSSPAEHAHDAARTDVMRRLGYATLRFQNEEISNNLDGVCETILARLEGRDTL